MSRPLTPCLYTSPRHAYLERTLELDGGAVDRQLTDAEDEASQLVLQGLKGQEYEDARRRDRGAAGANKPTEGPRGRKCAPIPDKVPGCLGLGIFSG